MLVDLSILINLRIDWMLNIAQDVVNCGDKKQELHMGGRMVAPEVRKEIPLGIKV